jgi:hypothetical protein
MKIKINNKILKTSQTVDCSTICKNITMCEDACIGFESKSRYIDAEPLTELDDDFRFDEDELIRSDNEYKRQGEEKWR